MLRSGIEQFKKRPLRRRGRQELIAVVKLRPASSQFLLLGDQPGQRELDELRGGSLRERTTKLHDFTDRSSGFPAEGGGADTVAPGPGSGRP